jgi:hypothetical protein
MGGVEAQGEWDVFIHMLAGLIMRALITPACPVIVPAHPCDRYNRALLMSVHKEQVRGAYSPRIT